MINNDKIKSLNPKQQAQEKLPIFYGSRDNYLHGFREVVANAVDEVYNNFDEGEIIVELHKDNKTISITDTGRGIPIHKKEIRNLLFQTLFAGTKLDANEKTTTGTNGCGTCVLCYTSEFFNVASRYNNKEHVVKYVNGDEIDYHEKEIDIYDKNGTTVTFKLMEDMYSNTVYSYDEILDIVKRSIVSTPKIKATMKYKGNEKTFQYKSLEEYFKLNTNNLENIIYYKPKKYEEQNKTLITEFNQIEVVLAPDMTPFQESYLNMNFLKEGGSINEGIINGVKTFINKYLIQNNLYNKNEKAINNKDVESSISFVVNHFSNFVEYNNQTKYSTAKKLYKNVAQNYIQEQLEITEKENPKFVEKMAKNILINKRAIEKTTETLSKIKKKLEDTITTNVKIEKFVDCKNHGITSSELYIAEGRSASGSIVLARNSDYQAVYPLRGKLLNILKTELSKILDNAEISDLIRILGCGVETKIKGLQTFDKSKLKFGKIIIATDQDTDGLHIQCLILVMLYVLFPTLIKEGNVYILNTPLFEIRDLKTDIMHYAFNEKEKDAIIKKLTKYQINRNKGLGELDASTMAECIKEDSNTKIQVKWEDAEEVAKWFNILMGDDAEERKNFVAKELPIYIEKMEGNKYE